MKSADMYRSFYATCSRGHIWALSARTVFEDMQKHSEKTCGEPCTLEDTSWEELEIYYFDNVTAFDTYVCVKRADDTPEWFDPIKIDENAL